ncbi:MAG: hypothetical protein WA364_05730 [Candidatus Nitrosopolaris sp.]
MSPIFRSLACKKSSEHSSIIEQIHCSRVFLGLIADFIHHILTAGKSQSLTTTSEEISRRQTHTRGTSNICACLIQNRSDLELRNTPFCIVILLEIISIVLMSYNIVSAQTYDTITKQKEILRNNPQIPLNQALLLLNPHRSVRHDIAVNPTTNEIYVTNLGLILFLK